MTLAEHVKARLTALGVPCSVEDGEVHIPREEKPTVRIRFEDDWVEAHRKYKAARSITYDAEKRCLVHNNSVEYQVTHLGQTASGALEDDYQLTDPDGNTVRIGDSSHAFALAFFDSPDYEKHFESRVRRRFMDSDIRIRRGYQLFWTPETATYTHRGRKTPADLAAKALSSINRSLFKIAVEQHDCLTVWRPRKRRIRSVYLDPATDDHSIPRVDYDENVVRYYKVAKASPFPSQSFLAYYHVLEYFFLRVSELLVHDRLTALINAPSFTTSRAGLDKVIAAVRGQDARCDETEMLRNVLERFVAEPDLIEFLAAFEEKCGDKIYTKRRSIFGEQMQISAIKDHALANAAKVIKHVRNAIVHSSDRYSREECHIPLSDSEEVIEEFIPLVRFLAERVIFGTAGPTR